MGLSGYKTPYAVLGHPIGHSLSPVMHNASLASLGEDAIYLTFDVHPDYLMEVLPAMGQMGFGGVNLTVPLKEVAFRGLESLDDEARLLGAVNTVEFGEDGLVGHNTDGYGFAKALEESFEMELSGSSVFVLGCGGAGRAVALTCVDRGCTAIVLCDTDSGRMEGVRKEISELNPEAEVHIASGTERQIRTSRECELIVQATPVGMKPSDRSLLGPESFRPDQKVIDLIYMYPETKFLSVARQAGAEVVNGLGMLLHQGARAYEIWTGNSPDIDAMRRALKEAVYGQ